MYLLATLRRQSITLLHLGEIWPISECFALLANDFEEMKPATLLAKIMIAEEH